MLRGYPRLLFTLRFASLYILSHLRCERLESDKIWQLFSACSWLRFLASDWLRAQEQSEEQVNKQAEVGPGLAQLVERLAHRYSESMSSNPNSLTSAAVRGDRTGCMPAAKRFGKCSSRGGSQGMYIMFASAMRTRQPTLALKPRGDVTRNPKQGYQWPQKRTCVRPKT